MNIKQQKKLYDLFNLDYSIKIQNHYTQGHYVDSFVHSIDINTDEKGQDYYEYDSELFSKRSLRTTPVNSVTVYKKINDWQNI